ncbi:MAG TPA: type II toxin-antitoxin system HicA family toxin [bacterium]|nr:type II toxin-antitoxin system HicA family toxin [bacterium]
MKRKDLIRELIAEGCYLKRHGKKHDIYMNPRNGKKAPVPRHSEIKDSLCELIKIQLVIKSKNGDDRKQTENNY